MAFVLKVSGKFILQIISPFKIINNFVVENGERGLKKEHYMYASFYPLWHYCKGLFVIILYLVIIQLASAPTCISPNYWG